MSSLFIGLGGVGTGTLEFLNKKMREYNDSLSSRDEPPVQAYYYYIDTDETIYNNDPSRFGFNTGMFFKLIGKESPDSLLAGYRTTGITDHLKWYDAPPKKTNLILGADSTRQYSRLALKSNYQDIYNELTAIIANVVAPQSRGRIYVVTGSCGGTGCGIYMDLLYMISQIYEQLRTPNQATDVRLIMAMPQGYIPSSDENTDIQRHKTLLNAYATLTELNAVSKDKFTVDAENNAISAFSFCNANRPVDLGTSWSFSPFRFSYLYDSANQSREMVSQKIADFVFEIELEGMNVSVIQQGTYCGSAFDIMLTNYVETDWQATSGQPFAKPFCSMGQFTIEKSDEIMRRYFKERLLYDVFHKGLIDSGQYNNDTSLVMVEANRLQTKIEETIGTICEEIDHSITKESLKTETLGDTVYKIFTTAPDIRNELTKVVLFSKSVLLDKVKKMTYEQCREWLKVYDFTTVFKIVDWLDVTLYGMANDANAKMRDRIDTSKADSKNAVKRWSADRAVKQFKEMVRLWLTFEVNKALTASETDITIDSKGYLDDCKTFITTAKRMLIMPKEYEEWESRFKKDVCDLKLKKDRCYLPELSEILDNNNQILRSSTMVQTYEGGLVVDATRADMNTGTCTIGMLQEEIFRQMANDSNLALYNIVLDDLFDPTPGASDSIRLPNKASRFVEEYITKAKIIINNILNANTVIQNYFSMDVVTRLASSLDSTQRARVCNEFIQYDNVELKTVDLPNNAVTTFKVYISNFRGNTTMQQQLGIVNMNGHRFSNSEILDDPFYADKIVKLIVKEGYSIDQYRYYTDYKKYAEAKMSTIEPHDPFIDKRFKGEIKRRAYDMDVFKAMHDIMTEARREADETQREQDIQDEYSRYSLDGISESEIYTATLSILYQYFNYLKKDKIRKELNKGISLKGTVLTFKKYEYRSGSGRFFEKSDVDTVDLKKAYGVNDFIELDMWIDEVLSHKDDIKSEKALIEAGLDFCYDNGIDISSELDEKIGSMKGTDAKPLYDFLRAYQIWLKNLR